MASSLDFCAKMFPDIRLGSSKVAVVVILKGTVGSGFCSPTLTWAQAAPDATVKSNAAFVNFIKISPLFYHFGIGIDTAWPAPRSATQIVSAAGSTAIVPIYAFR
jgi:hypothetical protein